MATEEEKKREIANRWPGFNMNPEWYETAEQMQADAIARFGNSVGNKTPQGGDDAQQAPQRAFRRPFSMQAYSGANPVQQGFINEFGPAAQARHLGGMINDVESAFRAENASRVAQARDEQEMAHEAEMEAMRQEALLQRLAMEQREREKDRILQKQLQTGITTRRLVNGRWEDV